MEKIKILYIDDELEISLSRYLSQLIFEDIEVDYEQFVFSEEENYLSLIEKRIIQQSNIIIIDSRLFSNSGENQDEFSGEEVMLLLQRMYPFIEVLIISQNDDDKEIGFIKKFNSRNNTVCSDTHYKNVLYPSILKAKDDILKRRRILSKIKLNQAIDAYIVEQIEDQIDGIFNYNNMTIKDVDNLVLAFNNLIDKYGGKNEDN